MVTVVNEEPERQRRLTLTGNVGSATAMLLTGDASKGDFALGDASKGDSVLFEDDRVVQATPRLGGVEGQFDMQGAQLPGGTVDRLGTVNENKVMMDDGDYEGGDGLEFDGFDDGGARIAVEGEFGCAIGV